MEEKWGSSRRIPTKACFVPFLAPNAKHGHLNSERWTEVDFSSQFWYCRAKLSQYFAPFLPEIKVFWVIQESDSLFQFQILKDGPKKILEHIYLFYLLLWSSQAVTIFCFPSSLR